MQKLDMRPAELNSIEAQLAIVIREISKNPLVLLIDRPEDFIGHAKFDYLVETFNAWISEQKPVVFVSYDRRLIRRFANRKVLITNGVLNTVNLV
jgi:ABC-type ATPase involved in cell division